jgi:hypothetical protein
MFIRAVKVKGHAYVHLVESYRDNGKIKQRYIGTICSQETYDLNGPEAFIDLVADLLKDSTDLGHNVAGTKKQVGRVIEGRAEDLLDDYDRRLTNKKVDVFEGVFKGKK